MTVSVQIYIFKNRDRRRLNLELSLRPCKGIQWDGEILTVSGDGYTECDDNALCFYGRLVSNDPIWFRGILSRMRHRMGRNGHGWPPVQGDQVNWEPLLSAIHSIKDRYGFS